MSQTASFTFHGLRRGFIAGQPFGLGVFAYGIAFGLLATQVPLFAGEALLMSTLVYSGSAQLAVINGLPQGTVSLGMSALGALMATIFLLNARYLLYSAALHPWLCQVKGWQAHLTLALLGDGNWVLSMKRESEGERDAAFVLGSGVASFLPWLLGTFCGLKIAGLIANPKLLALDFLLVAFAAAMAIGMMRGRSDAYSIGCVTLVAVIVDRVLPLGWSIVIAGIAGGLIAFLRWKPAP